MTPVLVKDFLHHLPEEVKRRVPGTSLSSLDVARLSHECLFYYRDAISDCRDVVDEICEEFMPFLEDSIREDSFSYTASLVNKWDEIKRRGKVDEALEIVFRLCRKFSSEFHDYLKSVTSGVRDFVREMAHCRNVMGHYWNSYKKAREYDLSIKVIILRKYDQIQGEALDAVAEAGALACIQLALITEDYIGALSDIYGSEAVFGSSGYLFRVEHILEDLNSLEESLHSLANSFFWKKKKELEKISVVGKRLANSLVLSKKDSIFELSKIFVSATEQYIYLMNSSLETR